MVWWHMLIITSLGRLRQVDHKLKDGSSYKTRLATNKAIMLKQAYPLTQFHFRPNSQTGSFSRAAHMQCQCLSAGGARKAQAGQQIDEKAK